MATHRAHSQDWNFDPSADGSGLVYIGPGSGWYLAPRWSEESHFGEEDDVEPLRGIYVVQGADSKRVKIGYSTSVYRRLASLRTGSPERLELIDVLDYSQEEEKYIHKRFAHHRTHGEWFEGDILEELHEYERV